MKPKSTAGLFAWLGSAASLFAVVTCYGTLAAVALLAAIGVSVDLNEGTLVIFITVLLGLPLQAWSIPSGSIGILARLQ
jgi:hypothetical protein